MEIVKSDGVEKIIIFRIKNGRSDMFQIEEPNRTQVHENIDLPVKLPVISFQVPRHY